MFYHYNLYGAVTGRITTSNYPVQGCSNESRKTIKPREGNIFIVADVSQEEVRIMTQISKDAALVKIFENNRDFHAYTASFLLGMSYKDFKELKFSKPVFFSEKRYLGKTLNFGLFFGMGKKTLNKNQAKGGIYLPINETQKQLNKWQKTYKGVIKYQSEMVLAYWKSKFNKNPVFFSYRKRQQNYHYLTSLGGRIKRDSDLDIGNVSFEKFKSIKWFLNECSNFPIQATGADILSEIWQILSSECYGFARVVMVVHDEIVVETHPDNYKKVVEKIKQIERYIEKIYLPIPRFKFEISPPVNSWVEE